MKLIHKIRIDRVIGLPLAYILNLLARILGFFLRIDHSLEKPVKRIAICKFVGMGSIVQSIPLIRSLRKKFPYARIIFITNQSNLSLFHFIPEVDEVYSISDRSFGKLFFSNLKLVFKLWKKRPEVYIDLEIYSNYSSMLATLSLSKNRMGFFKDDKTYRNGMYTHMMYFNIKSPVSQTYLQFARLMHCENLDYDLYFNRAHLQDSNFSFFHENIGVETDIKYILINPNASELRLERRWPVENMLQLIRSTAKEFPEYKLIFIGDNNEKVFVNSIVSLLGEFPQIIDSSGKLSLRELVFLISRASLMITNDTGPMHLAFALKTPTVSLFGPCSPQQYGGKEFTISIYKNMYCSPCVHEFLIPPCKGDNQCMKKITENEVFRAVKKALKGEFDQEFAEIDYVDSTNAALGVILR